MGDPLILNKSRLPVFYEYSGNITNPFYERFGRFEDIHEELIDIFDNNLTFAVYNLMKWKNEPLELAPFQSVILDTMWHKTFPLILMSRGGGKSFILAVYSILKAILVPGSKIVIVAASFRQSKIVFDYIKQIYDYSPLVQQCVTKIHTPNDQCLMEINDGMSKIIALPLGNGDKIRGIRATDIISDEFASIPEEIFQVVVRGFAAVAADPIKAAKQIQMEDELVKKGLLQDSERSKIRSNKVIYAGTASYQFNHFFKLWKTHKSILDNCFVGDASDFSRAIGSDDIKIEGRLDYRDYAIVQVPYNALPKGFMDDKQISQALATMPKSLFSMEYECQFPTDSDGFFKRSAINESTPGLEDGGVPFSVEMSGDPNFEYVMGVDPARKTDNFAISIVKILPGKGFKNVYCWTTNNKNFVSCVRKIRELLTKFRIVRIAMDAGGGGFSVEDLLQNVEILNPGEAPILRYNDPEHQKINGLHILDVINFTPSWIADANYGLAADIEHGRALFPLKSKDRITNEIDEDAIWDEIEEQINEMCMIVVTATKTGIQHFDLPEIPTTAQQAIKAEQRKDRYSALLLSSYAARTYVADGQFAIAPEVGDWVDFI